MPWFEVKHKKTNYIKKNPSKTQTAIIQSSIRNQKKHPGGGFTLKKTFQRPFENVEQRLPFKKKHWHFLYTAVHPISP